MHKISPFESTTTDSRPVCSRRGIAFCGLTMAALAACSHQPPEFAWSHSASGEYLFAFDSRECGDTARSTLRGAGTGAQGAMRSPEFFDCMSGRGYYLVDPTTGIALTHQATSTAIISPQALR